MTFTTARDTVALIASGKLSAREAVESALQSIERLEPALEAWTYVDAEAARSAAVELDRRRERLPLAGLPVGIKDIFDVAGMPTGFGAGAWARTHPAEDATAVARLRAAGALVIGKTHTTEFAYLDPAPTRNPWNREHTPGGSSSGSAAAVAAGMVPLALGTQTVGSVLRPAAYCGIVGLKPSHGRISTAGVYPLSPSFDHVGVLCRSVEDAALALGVLAGPDDADPACLEAPVDDYLAAVRTRSGWPRIGFLRAFSARAAEDAVIRHLEDVAGRLAAAGAAVTDVDLPLGPEEVRELGQPVMRAEAAAAHYDGFSRHAADYRPGLRDLIEAGQATGAVDYLRALEEVRQLRASLRDALDGLDALLLPSAPATAPTGLASTGNGIFCAPASFSGLPAIALPSGLDDSGLPLSVQLIGSHLGEAGLLAAAARVESVLDFRSRPELE